MARRAVLSSMPMHTAHTVLTTDAETIEGAARGFNVGHTATTDLEIWVNGLERETLTFMGGPVHAVKVAMVFVIDGVHHMMAVVKPPEPPAKFNSEQLACPSKLVAVGLTEYGHLSAGLSDVLGSASEATGGMLSATTLTSAHRVYSDDAIKVHRKTVPISVCTFVKMLVEDEAAEMLEKIKANESVRLVQVDLMAVNETNDQLQKMAITVQRLVKALDYKADETEADETEADEAEADE